MSSNETPDDDDNYYATHGERIASDQVPVVKDDAKLEDNIGSSEKADSDAQLGVFFLGSPPPPPSLWISPYWQNTKQHRMHRTWDKGILLISVCVACSQGRHRSY